MKYILTVLFLVQYLLLTAQTHPNNTIKGVVTDIAGMPISYASVVLANTNYGVVTNGDGQFSIKAPKGKYTLQISFLGYKTYQKLLEIKEIENTPIKIVLQEYKTNLDEVVVLGKTQATKLQESAQTVSVIETKEVKLQSADLGEVMAKTEGVSVQRVGGLGSNIRFALNGLSGDKIKFFYNDIPLNFTPYVFGIANVPVNAIKQIEVYKGVVPIQFGADALGGAVNLKTPTIHNGWSGSASYQTGSFNTHRFTVNVAYANKNSGWFVNTGTFVDYTDNNYKIDVAIANEQGKLQQETVERFHDRYKALGGSIKTGIRNKKWANELSFEGYYGNYDNQIQNSQSPGLIDYPELGIDKAVAGNPFGEVVFTSFSQGVNLNYNVNLANKWEVDLKAGYNYNESESFDVGTNQYNWYGEVERINNQAGEFGEDDHLITRSNNYFVRNQIAYALAHNHKLKLAIAPTYVYRTGDDLLIEGKFDPALDKGYLADWVTGLEYSGDLLEEQLQLVAFAKNYRQSIRIESIDPSVDGLQVNEREVNNYGAGMGLRYFWSPRFTTKLSYEYAYRLPRQNEIFGNGQLTGKNLDLEPENSHNVNVQWSLTGKNTTQINWQVQGNFFLRNINDLIFLVTNADGFGTYDNVWSANSQGIELGGQLKNIFLKGLSLKANTTYQSYFNTSDEGPFASYKGDRIPNEPYFFANGGLNYQMNNVIQKNDALSVFWNSRYVHPFYIGWESAGLAKFKSETPSQFTHVAGITQKMNIKNMQTALTLEVQNITNAKVFDMYGVQRPGRAFYVKLTTHF
ncbi:TonB-dependent receptor domain-containing protein [Aquimarina muelleri]|uniref:TonB-dependent receptor n=1 Tax=Aquimarina muelleri TaxID=279356 RepID=UPI003F684649